MLKSESDGVKKMRTEREGKKMEKKRKELRNRKSGEDRDSYSNSQTGINT